MRWRSVNLPNCFYLLNCIIKWIPVLLISAIIVSTYYCFVFQLCLNVISSTVTLTCLLIAGHILYCLLCWSILHSIFAPFPDIPDEFYVSSSLHTQLQTLNEDESIALLNNHARNLPVLCRLPTGSVRFCNICMCVKPDRCHHCSTCNRCILRMDHHCPWINGCVHFNNYKYFFLSILYGFLMAIFLTGSSCKYFAKFWTSTPDIPDVTRYCIIYLFLTCMILGVSLTSLLCFHIFLVAKNRTTLENYRPPAFANGPHRNAFDIDCKTNVLSIIGPFDWKFFLPLKTWRGDGIHFEPHFNAFDSDV